MLDIRFVHCRAVCQRHVWTGVFTLTRVSGLQDPSAARGEVVVLVRAEELSADGQLLPLTSEAKFTFD